MDVGRGGLMIRVALSIATGIAVTALVSSMWLIDVIRDLGREYRDVLLPVAIALLAAAALSEVGRRVSTTFPERVGKGS